MNIRKAQYVNVADKEAVSTLASVKSAFVETSQALAILAQERTKNFTIVKLIYCGVTGSFYKISGNSEDPGIEIERMTMTAEGLGYLHETYQALLPEAGARPSGTAAAQLEASWSLLYNFFLRPLGHLLFEGERRNILFCIDDAPGKKYAFDLSIICDLQYRFLDLTENICSYVVPITGMPLIDFAGQLAGSPMPIASRTILLNGLAPANNQPQGGTEAAKFPCVPPQQLNAMLVNAWDAGVKIVNFDTVGSLLQFMKKGWEGYAIQILAHYDRQGRVLHFGNGSAGFDTLLHEIAKLKQQGLLRDDIAIDPFFCGNCNETAALHRAGIKYVHCGNAAMTAGQAVATLDEMYSGANAHTLGWEYPYLNGQCYLHEAGSKVMRCIQSLKKVKAINVMAQL